MTLKDGQVVKLIRKDGIMLGRIRDKYESPTYTIGDFQYAELIPNKIQCIEDSDGNSYWVIGRNGEPFVGIYLQEATKEEKLLFYTQGSWCLND